MAGDWIPMRHDLWECPQMVRLVSAICPENVRDPRTRVRTRLQIIGALYRTWCLIDRFADDGILDGYTAELLDEQVEWPGWCENLQHIGWLVIEPQRLIVPEFEEWFDESAKRRAKDAKRKRKSRKGASEKCPSTSDKMRTTGQDNTGHNSKKESKPKKARFAPPTHADVTAYGREIGFDIDGEQFVDYYTTRGWVLSNGRQMRDWQAAVRTWKRNHRQRHGSEPASEDEAARAARKRAEDTRRLCEESLGVPDEPLSGESLVEEYRKRKGRPGGEEE